MRRATLLVALLVATLAGGCDPTASRPAGAPAAGVVDSALPIDTLLHRFRSTIADTPTVLTGGASSREQLVRELFEALERADSAQVRALALSKAEFAWLYYPHTRFTRPPYELGPALLWLTMSANHEKGRTRLERRLGGHRLRLEALVCPDTSYREGPNLVLAGCRVRFAVDDSTARELRIFGSLLSRDGRYKFVSYSNDL